MSECQVCTAKTDLYLCRPHTDELHDILTGLPRWLEYLADAAIGHTRLADKTRRTPGTEQPLQLNPRASDLYTTIHTNLADWTRNLGRINQPHLFTAGTLAEWLANHITATAAHEQAGEWFQTIRQAVDDIERVINRPIPPKFVGPCPTIVGSRECGRKLATRAEAVEVTCGGCKATHNVEQLMLRLYNQAHYKTFTISELVSTILPRTGDPIPRSTIYDWVKAEKLVAKGVRGPGELQEGEPVYLLADVRRLRALRKIRSSA